MTYPEIDPSDIQAGDTIQRDRIGRSKTAVGDRYGRLVVEGDSGQTSGVRQTMLLACRCDCGASHLVTSAHLRNGDIRSCGCLSGIPKDESIADRLGRLSEMSPSGCREWSAYIDPDGYGKVKFQGKYLAAHRVAHTVFSGEIPDGFEVDHLCRNTRCILPAHLEAVPGAENLRRQREALKQGEYATHCGQGHALDEENLYITPSGNNKCRACGREAARRHYWTKKAAQS